MAQDDWERLALCYDRVVTAPITIDDRPNLTVMQARAKARQLKQGAGLELAVFDYAQLAKSGRDRKHENRQTEVTAISNDLKLMARELNIPVIVLAQLNRGPVARADKKPMMSDLRESGALEQDADVVILLHREDAYEAESPRAGEADFIIAKHRNGPTGIISVAFQGHYSRFVDMADS
jgi:replicative DNA helicase